MLRFGHAENILPLVTSFNLFKDEVPLKGDNYYDQAHRLFKSNIITPFSSNIALVLLKCNNTDNYKVKLLVNELPIGIINSGNLECNDEESSENLKLKDSICNYLNFKQKLIENNKNCFSNENVCEVNEKEEL